nr:MAG TPA: hypothetical protein [Caudoviricetes sp.]
MARREYKINKTHLSKYVIRNVARSVCRINGMRYIGNSRRC